MPRTARPAAAPGAREHSEPVSSRLTGLIDGQTIVEAEDPTISAGMLGLGLGSRDQEFSLDSVEYLDLDPPASGQPAPAAVPAAVTKDAPFVNSLGMKFVPVPITGGPTAGQRVLFSIWETRVQDYERFATETNRQRLKPKFEQGPMHPVVNVSWEDAAAMCEWMTAQARRDGSIGTRERFRLPSDHEWSCAVEIGEREDAALPPWEKDRKIPGLYAWGKSWPPPDGFGNYADETAKERRAKDGEGYINGYQDGFPWTAPVGGFAPNVFGLYDLDGNAREWCSDLKSGSLEERRVVRGGSWGLGGPDDHVLSRRDGSGPATRSHHHGFRVVLAPETGAQP